MASVASKPDDLSLESAKKQSVFSMPLEDLMGWFVIFGCAFLNLANLLQEKEEVGLDFQVLAKLGLVGLGGLYGCWGLLTRPAVRRMLTTFPVVWLLLIGACYFIAIPFSISPQNSLVSSCSIVAVVVMTLTALDHLGVMRTFKAIFAGAALFIIGSWIFYFAVPDIGRFAEPIADGEFVHRMSGLAHPNTLGQFSGLTFVLCAILYFSYRERSPFILLIGILALAALVSSLSRTSLMASVLALAVGYRHLFLKKKYVGNYLLITALMLVGILILSTQVDLGRELSSKLGLLSKSGGSEELTTATGRADIWAHAIHLIQKQPLTGYGAATQKFFFVEHSFYTHNMVLNIAFSGGIFAGIAALMMIFGRVRDLFFNNNPLVDSLVVFFIINGLFENVIFSILAGLPTIIWVIILAWPHLQDDPAVKQLNRSKRVRDEGPGRFIRLDS